MSTLAKLKEEHEKEAQIEAQISQLSNQVMKLYHVGNPAELQQKIHETLESILKRDFSLAEKELQTLQEECKQSTPQPSLIEQQQHEMVGPFFYKDFDTFFKRCQSEETRVLQTPVASLAA